MKRTERARSCTTFSEKALTAQLEQHQMQQDENQKVAMAIVSPTEDRAVMSRTRGSLRQQRVDARQRMSEGSAARDALQQWRMELTEELHKAEIACVSEQCQARTSQLDGTLTQNAW